LWIGLGTAVVVVAALLVTGFVAPGFFLGEEKAAGGAPSSTPSSKPSPELPSRPSASGEKPTGGGSPDKEQFAVPINAFIDKVNAGDADGAMRLVCAGDTGIVRTRLTKVLAKGTPKFYSEAVGLVTRGFANAYLAGTLDGKPLPEEKDPDGITVSKGRIGSNNVSGDWCVDGFRTGIFEIDGN
jgi:hypothetical protein